MSKKRRALTKAKPEKLPGDPGAAAATAALAFVLLGTQLFVDSGADASFDAPKRLVAQTGLALAAVAAFAWLPKGSTSGDAWRQKQGPKAARAAAWLALAAVVWALVAAGLSPRRLPALDSWRALLITSLAIPLGASRVVARRSRLLLGVLLGACAINTAISLAQSRGAFYPFELSVVGPRDATGAYAGNVGYLAIAIAMAAVAALGTALFARTLPMRIAGAALLALFAAGLAVNLNLTSLTAAGAGFAILLGARFGRRAWIPMAAALLALASTAVLYQPLRQRARSAIASARAGDWDRLVTYRGGPWTAALEMFRERPLTGFGPGMFGAEFVPHRLAAEMRYRRRFVNPLVTSSYGEAHCEYLQAFADAGLPGALAALLAATLLVRGAARRALAAPQADRAEAAVILALLAAGAASALTWFPLQRPISAVPLLLVAGRAWRMSNPATPNPKREILNSKLPAIVVRLALVAVLAAALWPEIPRYAAERRLRAAQGALRFVLMRTTEVTDPPAALARVADLALGASGALPGDPRPYVLAGAARRAAGEGDRALELFRSALATGERAEIDLNLGRTSEALGRMDESRAWFIRGGWVSPPLLATLLPDIVGPIREEIARLEADLVSGRLKAPPPLP
ncbi:MAG TPA: O-antigen ligase family protein [Thermoanaerobaculia bacterium]|nr:O-antigen ligase family protein [Thermoanaerobaculia bacterium]